MYKDLINQRKRDFDAAVEHARNEVAAIRTGRANASLVENFQIEYMGSKLRLKELATISVPDARTLLIQPWDKQVIPSIEKVLRESGQGLNPVSDRQSVRVSLPALSEERRREFIRLLHQKVEESRIKIRQLREDILKKVQTEMHEKKAREDDLWKAKDELQKIIDDVNDKLAELTKRKEQELLSL